MGYHLAWSVGNGKMVCLGVDPFVSEYNFYSVSHHLINHLIFISYYKLTNVKTMMDGIYTYWLFTGDLGLKGSLEYEWNQFI